MSRGPAEQGARPARAVMALSVCAIAIAAAGPGTARAGTWRLLSCTQPDGEAAPTEGWTTSSTGTVGPDSGDLNTCETGGALIAIASGEAPQNAYAGPQWVFTAPAGSTIAGGTITASISAPHGQAWLGTPQPRYDSADVLANCQYNLSCGDHGTVTGAVAITHTGGTHVYATAVCVGEHEGDTSCPAHGGIDAEVAITAADIELSNDTTPTASDFAGSLLQSPLARGSEDLTFTASDPDGPGVRLVTVQLDGQTAYTGTPEDNDGLCVPSGEEEGVPRFTAAEPCKQSEAIDLPIDTTSVPDGAHTLKVIVSDAAGNTSTVYDQAITTENAPTELTPPAIAGAAQAGSTLSASTGEWSAPPGTGAISYSYQWEACNDEGSHCEAITGAAGTGYTPDASSTGTSVRVQLTATDKDGSSTATSAPTPVIVAAPTLAELPGPGNGAAVIGASPLTLNGTNASSDAQLSLTTPSTLRRPYVASAITISGRLTNGQGQPIGAATLNVLEQVASAGPEEARTVTSGSDGAFTVRIPDGPSRRVTIGYRKSSTNAAYDAKATVTETVSAAVQMRISPRRTEPSGTITISGQVGGPLPRGGILVVLLVHYRGAWVPFRTPRTDSDGRFHIRYQFQGATGRFPFRAQAPGGQTGFPFATGTSAAVDVRSG